MSSYDAIRTKLEGFSVTRATRSVVTIANLCQAIEQGRIEATVQGRVYKLRRRDVAQLSAIRPTTKPARRAAGVR